MYLRISGKQLAKSKYIKARASTLPLNLRPPAHLLDLLCLGTKLSMFLVTTGAFHCSQLPFSGETGNNTFNQMSSSLAPRVSHLGSAPSLHAIRLCKTDQWVGCFSASSGALTFFARNLFVMGMVTGEGATGAASGGSRLEPGELG